MSCDAEQSPQVQELPQMARGTFARLARDGRMLWLASLLLIKLALIGQMAIFWMAELEQATRPYAWTTHGLMLLGALVCGTVVLVLAVCDMRRWMLLGIAVTLLCAAGIVVAPQLFTPSYGWSGIPAMQLARFGQRLLRLAYMAWLPVVSGGLAGMVLFWAARASVRSIEFRGGMTGALPMLGEAPGEKSYRDLVDEWLAWLDDSVARHLTVTRVLVIGTIAILMALMSFDTLPNRLDWRAYLLHGMAGAAAGVMLGVALLPMRAGRAMALTAGLCVVSVLAGSSAALTGLGRGSGLSAVLMLAATATGAVLALLATRFIGGWLIKQVLPRPIRSHLLGRAEPPPLRRISLKTCEGCGYELEGLPETTCPACNITELRCPECGRTQPANTVHGRAVLKGYAWNVVMRVMTWLHALPLLMLPLVGWFVFGAEGVSRLNVEMAVGGTVFAIAMLSPMRIILLHMRLGAVLTFALPTMALFLGTSVARETRWDGVALLVVLIGAATVLAPLLWRGWLWAMYGAQGAQVYAWQVRPAMARTAEAVMQRETWALGSETGRAGESARCNQCGVAHLVETPSSAVSAARVGFESLLARARLCTLALVAGTALAAAYVGGLIVMINQMAGASQLTWNSNWTGVVAFGAFLPGALGLALRLMTIRRSFVPVSICVVIIWLVLWSLPTYTLFMSIEDVMNSWLFRLQMVALISGLVGAAIALPLLRLATSLLTGTEGRPLLQWLRGRG